MNEVLTVFKALSDKNRLLILKILQQGELCGCHLVAALGLVQPQISFHIKRLKKAGLILDRRCGRWTYYRLNDTDMFIRFLLMAALERMESNVIASSMKRLGEFRKSSTNPCR
ncbi:MAG TPA: metalloregulator ArsR/SmtB family transcription factor [Dissulfurispiraceae bacterium]|nr:metalloregulator ArsR/SmtB family transcription factor [Dissulfurispiraceae bacterium]